MKALDRLRGWLVRNLEPPSTLKDPAKWFVDWAGSSDVVTETTARNLVAVGACVKILSDSVASLPLHVYEELERGRQRMRGTSLYRLLHSQPNPLQSSFAWRYLMQSDLSLSGNAYSEIQRDDDGQPVALWRREPAAVTPELRDATTLVYKVSCQGGIREVQSENMLHLMGHSTDGIRGMSPVQQYRQAIGLGLALEKYGNKFFANGGHVHLWVKYPRVLGDKALKNLRESFEKLYSGMETANRTAVLEDGAELHSLSMPHDDAQFLETRKFQLAEIGRIYRIPLHLLDETDKAATYASVEQFQIMFVVHTMRPILVQWEQELNRKLMPEDGSLYCEFAIDGLLRGDQKSRYEAYAIGRQNGFLSQNDIRVLENMDPIPGGDVYLQPLNMVPVGTPPAPQPTTTKR